MSVWQEPWPAPAPLVGVPRRRHKTIPAPSVLAFGPVRRKSKPTQLVRQLIALTCSPPGATHWLHHSTESLFENGLARGTVPGNMEILAKCDSGYNGLLWQEPVTASRLLRPEPVCGP